MSYRKFRNVPTIVDGIRFLSKLEAKRYGELKLLQRAGKISELEVHPRFDLIVNHERICIYEADFRYVDVERGTVVEDTKGARTALFILKKKLMKAVRGIEVQEVRAKGKVKDQHYSEVPFG